MATTNTAEKTAKKPKGSQTSLSSISQADKTSVAALCLPASKTAHGAKRPAPTDSEGQRQAKRTKVDLQTEKNGHAASLRGGNRQDRFKLTPNKFAGKRKAVEDDDAKASKKRQKTNSKDGERDEGAKTTITKKSLKLKLKKIKQPSTRRLRGLVNHRNACFSAAVIQMFDAALEGYDLDKLLGERKEVEKFGLDEETCTSSDRARRATRRSKAQPGLKQKAKSEIIAAAVAGETENISPAIHLRNLLGEMRSTDMNDDYISPLVFQSVFAFGAKEDIDKAEEMETMHRDMIGDTQEDASEYYGLVLHDLINDPHVGDSKRLKDLFTLETATTGVCNSQECAYESEPKREEHTEYRMRVPEDPKKQGCSLLDLFDESQIGETDQKCPRCANGELENRTSLQTVGDNIVIRLNRDRWVRGGPSKIMTRVDIDLLKIGPEKKSQCELNAVIFHKGPNALRGHYTIMRKHRGDWYIIDDKTCIKTTIKKVGDCAKFGQASMLLYKRPSSD